MISTRPPKCKDSRAPEKADVFGVQDSGKGEGADDDSDDREGEFGSRWFHCICVGPEEDSPLNENKGERGDGFSSVEWCNSFGIMRTRKGEVGYFVC